MVRAMVMVLGSGLWCLHLFAFKSMIAVGTQPDVEV